MPDVPGDAEWADDPLDAPVGDTDPWVAAPAVPPPKPPPPAAPAPRLPSALEETRLLEAIGERATTIRSRRRLRALGVMTSALVLLLVVTALRLRPESDDLATTPTSTTLGGDVVDPAFEEGEDPDLTSSTVSLPPLVNPVTVPTSTTVRPTASTVRPATTTSLDDGPPGDRRDGVPGWRNDETSCTEAYALPEDGGAPSEVLTLTVEPGAASLRAGASLDLVLTIENTGGPVTLFYRTPTSRTDAWFLESAGIAASATLSDGESAREAVVVPPGSAGNPGRVSLQRTVRSVRCGDTSRETPPPLRAGSYLVGASLDVSRTATGPLEPWRSPTTQVDVV